MRYFFRIAVRLSSNAAKRNRPHRERPTGHAVDEESCVGGVLRQAGEVLGRELSGMLARLLREPHRVVGADLEGDD